MTEFLVRVIGSASGSSSASSELNSSVTVFHIRWARVHSNIRWMVCSGSCPQFEQLGLMGLFLVRLRGVPASLTLVHKVLRKIWIEVHWTGGERMLDLVESKDLENSFAVMSISPSVW